MFPVLTNRYSRVPEAATPIDWVDREFGRMIRHFWGEGNGDTTPTITYPMNIWETDDAVHVEAEMPGFKREEVDITLERGVLCITAQRRQHVDNTSEGNGNGNGHSGRNHLLTERRFARYQRTFTLPTTIDEESVQARLEDGVLHLTLPKRAEVKPRKIQVN